jgi:hypothetical protein
MRSASSGCVSGCLFGHERGLEFLGYLRGQGAPEPENAASEVFVGMVRTIGSIRPDRARYGH